MKIKTINTNDLDIKSKNFIKDLKTITLLGDSHTLCFCGSSLWNKNLLIDDNTLIINRNRDSVSISGLNNPKSKTGYNKIINDNFKNKINCYNLFKLGQVDVEYVYYYKTLVKMENITKTDFYTNIIDKYLEYLNKFNNGNKIICGINLHASGKTDFDINYLKTIIGIDIDIDKTLFNHQIKMEDHLKFNKILKEKCILNNITYFDLTEECIEIKNNSFELKQQFKEGGIHYKGANGCVESNIFHGTAEYRASVGDDYINCELYRNTYHTFLNKLCQHC